MFDNKRKPDNVTGSRLNQIVLMQKALIQIQRLFITRHKIKIYIAYGDINGSGNIIL